MEKASAIKAERQREAALRGGPIATLGMRDVDVMRCVRGGASVHAVTRDECRRACAPMQWRAV